MTTYTPQYPRKTTNPRISKRKVRTLIRALAWFAALFVKELIA